MIFTDIRDKYQMGLLDSEISKDIRSRLLKRNIVTSTVERNGLSSLLYSIGKPAIIGGISPNIIDSEDLEDIGSTVRDFILVNNKYIATPIEYERVSINTNSTDITTQYPNYLERVSNLVGGGASSNAGNIINNVLGGLVPKYSVGGGNPLFDVGSILGGGSNPSNETQLGIIGANQLGFAIQVNSAFNLYEETLGTVNTNPISLLMGNPIIFPNYKITVAKGTGGVVLDYAERILGFNTPVSLLATSSSIFAKESGPITNTVRANNMITNTGKGQVSALFWLMNNPDQKYKPSYRDERNPNSGVNGNLYAFQYGQNDNDKGNIIDMLNGDENNPISKSNYDLENMIRDSGFRGVDEIPRIDDVTYVDVDGELYSTQSDFTWRKGDEGGNKLPSNFSKESILSKTKKLFDTNNVVSTLSPYIKQLSTETNSAVNNGYMSTGSGSIKFNGITPETDPEKMFFRTFNTAKRYDRVNRLQKHSGVNLDAGVSVKKDATFSVLDDNGFVKVAPYGDLPPSGEMKKYMFSIENLAWYGYTNNLIPEEVGNGDPISGKKGRIMWFPPYDLSFTDNTSVNWEKTDFIGRGEPIYTYNNTNRTGNIQFKIIIDHPSYINSLKGESDDLINSLFTGGFEVDKRVKSRLSENENVAVDLALNQQPEQINNTPQSYDGKFAIYFPFKTTTLQGINYATGGYESGLLPPPFSPQDVPNEDNPTGTGSTFSWVDDNGIIYITKTNFGFNSHLPFVLNNLNQNDWYDVCPACKIVITSYGHYLETIEDLNKRNNTTKEWFKAFYGWDIDTITESMRYELNIGGLDSNSTSYDSNTKYSKAQSYTIVDFKWSAEIAEQLNPNAKPKEPDPISDTNLNRTISNNIKERFYSEIGYFQKLQQTDKFVYDKISQKIAFFHPAFHSITPEGFNSRLTFLKQCTRQGPTVFQNNKAGGVSFDLNRPSDALSPDNMAFGQPPVCILRLGDFYHTKIIIDSMNFSFDPLVWDLNPEGIGVQPMICTVDMNFAFVGGSSLQGPITKLQNAVTYNFFANTQMFSPQSNYTFDSTITVGEGDDSVSVSRTSVGGGIYPTPPVISTTQPSETPGINTNNTNTTETDQGSEADVVNGPTTPPVSESITQSDFDRLTITKSFWDGTTLVFNIGRKDGTDNTSLSKDYTLDVSVNNAVDLIGSPNINYQRQTLNAVDLNQQYSLESVLIINTAIISENFPVGSENLTVKFVGTDYKLTSNIS